MSKVIASIIAGPIGLIDKRAGEIISGTILTVAGIVTGNPFLTALGTFELGQAFAPRPPKPTTTETAIKTERPPRVSAYGTLRLHGAYILYETATDGSAVDVMAYHDGQISAVRQYYVGDRRVTLSGGFVQKQPDGAFGKSSDVVQCGINLGAPIGTAWAQVIAKVPDHWTANHRGDGVVTGFMISRPVKSKNYQSIYPTGGPNSTPLSFAGDMQPVFDWRDNTQSVDDPRTWKFSENAVLHTCHYLLVRMAVGPTRPPSDPAYWSDVAALLTARWNAKFAPNLAYFTAAANDAGSSMPLKGVQTVLSAESKAGRTSVTVDRVTGLTTGMTISIYVSGDNARTETRTVTGISGTTISFADDLDYDHPIGSQVLWASSSGSPATEMRYRSCVAHQHTDAHKDVLANLLNCFDGWLSTTPDGAYILYSGRYVEPTDAPLNSKEIVSMTIQRGVNEEDAINAIKVSYISAPHDYSTVSTDDWLDEDDIERRGKVLSDSLDNQVPSHAQARRLAKRAMAKINAPFRGTVTTTASARRFLGKRYIPIDYTVGGVTLFGMVVEVDKITRNLKTGGLTIQWHAADPNIDAWNPATEEGDPAPVGNRVALQPVDAPTVTSAVTDYSSVSDDGTGVRVIITAEGPARDDLIWYARWRVVGSTSWNESQYTDIDASASVELVTGFVPAQAAVEVEVAYQTGDGRLSDYSDPPYAVDTATDTTPPDAAPVPTLVSWAGSLNLQLNANIGRARTYRWNFYEDDGTTLVATHETPDRSINYSSSQAAIDGVRRSYVVGVQGVNSAGAGTEAKTGIIANAAPPAVTTPAIAGGDYTATATCDAETDPDVAGYAVFYSNTAGFDPLTTGGYVTRGIPSVEISGLAAGTYYGHIAAFDDWSSDPSLLNLSGEISFAIAVGGGSTPTGGGTGGGGYSGGCPEINEPVLMANEARDGPGDVTAAGDICQGDYVWAQHYTTGQWGAWQVLRADTFDAEIWTAPDMPEATAPHVFLIGDGRRCVRMDAIGEVSRPGQAVLLTIKGAETFIIVMGDGRWVDNHNKRAQPGV